MEREILDLDLEKLQEYVQTQMAGYRFVHTLGVVETAKDLAAMYGVDPKKASLAALFHDLAKEFPVDQKKALCLKYHIELDGFFAQNIDLTHGAIAAAIAKEAYGVEDKEILKAISHHTFGGKNMSNLEKIIYLADMIEPNRQTSLELEKLRMAAYTDLDKGMKLALSYSISHLKATNKDIHPMIYSMIEEYNKTELEEIDEGI